MSRRRTPRATDQPPRHLDGSDPWKKQDVKAAIAQRLNDTGEHFDDDFFDDYVNPYTGIGDWTQDKMYGGSQAGLGFVVQFISAVGAENRWRGSDLGARIVETIPDEMTREGWEVSVQPSDKDGEDEADPKDEGALGDKPEPDDPVTDAFGGAPPPGMGAAQFGLPPPKPQMPPVDDEGAEIEEEIEGALEELGVVEAIKEALDYERAYGGSAILIGADDGTRDMARPLDEENITEVKWLNVLQGGYDGEIVAWSYYRDPTSPKYGMPEIYMVRNLGVPIARVGVPGEPAQPAEKSFGSGAANSLLFWVHESRLLVFPGKSVSRRARVQMRGWGDSLFTRVDTVLSQFGQTWAGIANMMSSFVQDVLKMSGNATKMSMGDKAAKGNPLTNRARIIQRTKSIARMLVIDTDEEYDRKTAPLAGAGDILDKFMLRLAAAADMPVTLLMGQAPAGLNATGASDIRFFYDRIASRQRRTLAPLLKRLIKLLFLSKEGPTDGVEPERWSVKFNSLYQLSQAEQATMRYQVAQTDQIYINGGVTTPEEVAASRFGGSAWSMETTIDFDGRAKMAEQDATDRDAKMKMMSESAKAGVAPHMLPLDHPEHPNNATPPEEPPPKKDNAGELGAVADALKTMREAGVVMDDEKVRALFPDLPIKRVIEGDE